MEEYGYDEDEAIDMINEMNMDMGYQAHENFMNNVFIQNHLDAQRNAEAASRYSKEASKNFYNSYKKYKKETEDKKSKFRNRKDKGRKPEKKSRFKRLREDYGIFEEDGELFIDTEMVEAVMESYELTEEEEAIDVIMESYEEELETLDTLDESVLNRSKIPASVTYHRYINAQNKASSRKREGNADKYEKAAKKVDKLEGKLRKQVGEYNKYQNERFVKYTSKGKTPKKYNQIYLK